MNNQDILHARQYFDRIANTCDYIDKKNWWNKPDNINLTLRDILQNDIEDFIMYLSASDGTVSHEEINAYKAITGSAEDNFNAAKHFTNHIDHEISAKAAELLTDKYTLSKMHTKQDEYSGDPANLRAVQDHQAKLELQKKEILAREVNTVIHEYKAAIISEREREIDQKIKQAQESGNFDEIMDFMRQKQIIIEHKKALSKEIGGRVVLWRR